MKRKKSEAEKELEAIMISLVIIGMTFAIVAIVRICFGYL